MISLFLKDTRIPLQADQVQGLADVIFQGEGSRVSAGLVVIDDQESLRLNTEFLQHEWATDVIAFDLRSDESESHDWEAEEEAVDGEIYVNAEMAQRVAAERKIPAQRELLFYVAHGLLHLLGHDDHDPKDREAMLALQRRYLEEARIDATGL